MLMVRQELCLTQVIPSSINSPAGCNEKVTEDCGFGLQSFLFFTAAQCFACPEYLYVSLSLVCGSSVTSCFVSVKMCEEK